MYEVKKIIPLYMISLVMCNLVNIGPCQIVVGKNTMKLIDIMIYVPI